MEACICNCMSRSDYGLFSYFENEQWPAKNTRRIRVLANRNGRRMFTTSSSASQNGAKEKNCALKHTAKGGVRKTIPSLMDSVEFCACKSARLYHWNTMPKTGYSLVCIWFLNGASDMRTAHFKCPTMCMYALTEPLAFEQRHQFYWKQITPEH